uniref:Ciliary neurotrophic factor n=1 Tax=Salarias fasciatus TaxID=181472 RepID=A0A672FRP6_SALFA
MDGRRTRRTTGGEMDRGTAARVAELLLHECSILLELYRKKEAFTAGLADQRLVSVPLPSSQTDAKDKLWCLHSALLQCLSLLERAIIKEEEELGGGVTGEYEKQRKLVKDRLEFLIRSIGELLRATDGGAVLTPSAELNSPTTVFELKVWVYQIFREVDYWTRTTVATLKDLPTVIAKREARTTRAARSIRNTRKMM